MFLFFKWKSFFKVTLVLAILFFLSSFGFGAVYGQGSGGGGDSTDPVIDQLIPIVECPDGDIDNCDSVLILPLTARTSDSCGEKVHLDWDWVDPNITDYYITISSIEYKVYKNNILVKTIIGNRDTEIVATYADIFTVGSLYGPISRSAYATPSIACPVVKPIITPVVPTPPTDEPVNPPPTIPPTDEPVNPTPNDNPISPIDNLVTPNGETNNNPSESKSGLAGLGSEISSTTQKVIVEVQKVLESKAGDAVAKTVTTAGVVVGGGAVASSLVALNGFVVTDLFFLPVRLWGLLMSVLGLKKRNRPWGTVFDSVTKQPLDPAYVTLKNLDTQVETTSITDLDGRYGFLVAPGRYSLTANKTNYDFPSLKLHGQTEDALYRNLYLGGEITVMDFGSVISKNIPLDPQKFDWNEFVKEQKKIMKFYSRRQKIIKIVNDWLFRLGFVISLVSLFLVPAPYNYIIFGLYILLIILRRFGLRTKALGSLTEADGNPLSFAIVRVFDRELNVEIVNKVADKFGRYFCLVPPGEYYVKIEKKNDDESYTTIFTSPAFTAKGGIINKNFVI